MVMGGYLKMGVSSWNPRGKLNICKHKFDMECIFSKKKKKAEKNLKPAGKLNIHSKKILATEIKIIEPSNQALDPLFIGSR